MNFRNPDNNPDKMSGLVPQSGAKRRIATRCREAKSPLPPARFSRQFSRQSVASDGVPSQAIPTVSGHLPGHLPGHFVRMAQNFIRSDAKHAVNLVDILSGEPDYAK